ncbi:hypothetical protein [Streptomyces hygroscopicus]|uniref:hypothetical protein n=1 Tax=Streptomyces hygroscopicus TaxID=1912 RepID=UPI0036C87057
MSAGVIQRARGGSSESTTPMSGGTLGPRPVTAWYTEHHPAGAHEDGRGRIRRIRRIRRRTHPVPSAPG